MYKYKKGSFTGDISTELKVRIPSAVLKLKPMKWHIFSITSNMPGLELAPYRRSSFFPSNPWSPPWPSRLRRTLWSSSGSSIF